MGKYDDFTKEELIEETETFDESLKAYHNSIMATIKRGKGVRMRLLTAERILRENNLYDQLDAQDAK